MLKKIIICGLSLLIGLTLFSSQESYASEFNFGVYTNIPDNQIDKNQTYFDLLMKPEQHQELSIELKNDTDKDVVIEPKVHSATTNINGVVEYGEVNKEKDATLKYDISELITTEKEITVPKHGSYELKLNVHMPKEEIKGQIAGGITLQEKDSNKSKHSGDKGLSIENKYAYVVAILLREYEETLASELNLNSVQPGQVNARNVISVNIQNPISEYLKNFSTDVKITKKGEEVVQYEASKKNMQVAPNSNFDLPTFLNGKKLEPGEYTLHLHAKATNGEWNLSKDFTIKGEEAQRLNDTDVTIENNNMWLYILIGISLIGFALLLLYLFLRKKKKEKKTEGNTVNYK